MKGNMVSLGGKQQVDLLYKKTTYRKTDTTGSQDPITITIPTIQFEKYDYFYLKVNYNVQHGYCLAANSNSKIQTFYENYDGSTYSNPMTPIEGCIYKDLTTGAFFQYDPEEETNTKYVRLSKGKNGASSITTTNRIINQTFSWVHHSKLTTPAALNPIAETNEASSTPILVSGNPTKGYYLYSLSTSIDGNNTILSVTRRNYTDNNYYTQGRFTYYLYGSIKERD